MKSSSASRRSLAKVSYESSVSGSALFMRLSFAFGDAADSWEGAFHLLETLELKAEGLHILKVP